MTKQPLALVTGAAHRLGKAIIFTLARHGYAVLLHYWSSEKQAFTAATELQALGVPVFLAQADLTDPNNINSLFEMVDKIPHPLKVLVNSAGEMRIGDPLTLSVIDWDSVLDLNLRAPFLCSQQAAKRMSDGGLIINISDVGAQKAWRKYPSYAVSKAGLEALTKILARAFGPTIRVNSIAPGLVLQSDQISPEEWNRLIERIPLKRSGSTEEIASALEFLLNNEYITGQTLIVDGGYSLLG